MDSMRLIREVPTAKKYIRNGQLNLTNASLAWGFRKSEGKDVVSALLGKTTREAEKILMDMAAPDSKFRRKSKLRRVTGADWELTVTITEATQEKLRKIWDIRSHSTQSWEDLLDFMTETTLKELTKKRNPQAATTGRCVTGAASAEYMREAEYKCSHPGCEATSFLQVDHIHAYSKGGKTERGNLRVLCAAHNRFKGSR